MPLTFSHPAIVLPLNYLPKRWVSLTGLIVGSVVPDFEYFIRLKVFSIYSHKWAGLFWFDLPMAILLTFVYHDIVRASFLNNLPNALNLRFFQFNKFNWNQYFVQNVPVVIISILIGGASHLFWDSFTHINGYFVVKWSMAGQASLFGMQIPLYKMIQHISTIVGGAVIIVVVCRMPVEKISKSDRIWPYWFIAIGVALVVVALRLTFSLGFHQYWNILVTAISGTILGVIMASIFYQTRKSINS